MSMSLFIYQSMVVDVLRNSELLDTIAGLEFKKAFFGIWLSDNPVQKSLKKAMLGN